ncbi:MAG: MBL fold metallo-hydrolase [Candidatus Moranbacteria bacterium]|nr:MBL fold metallo-hydrolase [Candidatus Moranbacteria bacterium]
MIIQYYGDFCFKITTKPGGRATEDVVLWTDPLPKGAGLRSPQGVPNVLLLSHQRAILEDFKNSTVCLDIPGEYSALNIPFQGFLSYRDSVLGAERGQNTFFTFDTEDIHVVFLGALGHSPSPEMFDKLSQIDVLFLPIGGEDTLSVEEAVDLIHKIEPKIVIPMHYAMNGLTLPKIGTKKAFCEAMGISGDVTQAKLTFKKKDLEDKKAEVIFLERGA